MPEVFKKTFTHYWLYNAWIGPDGLPCAAEAPGARFVESRRVPAGTPGAVMVKTESTNYFGRVPGKREPIPLCANKAASKTMLSNEIGKSALKSRGLDDPHEEHRVKPLLEHLDDFIASMRAKGDDERHVEETDRLIRAFLAGVKAVHPPDLNIAGAQAWLTELQADRKPADPGEPDVPALPASGKRPALPAGWSVARVAELLGVKQDSVSPLVKRRNLHADGNGRARRLPIATVEALLADRGQGASPETVNHYIRAMRSFCRWMVKPGRRMRENPLDDLEVLNADADRRRIRRELTLSELGRVLLATRESKATFRGLDGEARFHLYALACGTGFRAGGLDSLTPECFSLDGRLPVVTLPVRGDKSRRGKVQPLPADVADLFRAWLAGKPEGQPLWPGTWAEGRRGAEMLRRDLAEAGVPYAVAGPDGPMYADFHALRHTYLTLGGKAGIDLRTLQELAGHSNPTLTARYTHVRLHDQAGAVEKMPGFLPQAAEEEKRGKASG